MQSVLAKCELADLAFLVGLLRSPVSFSDDLALAEALARYRHTGAPRDRRRLTRLLEREIRYAGSADLAYCARWLLQGEGGVSPNEIVDDVAQRLKVKVRPVGPLHARLEHLARATVEKELLRLSPEEQRLLLEQSGIGPKAARRAVSRLKRQGPLIALPVMLRIAGLGSAERLAPTLVMRTIAVLVGRDTAKELVKVMSTRFPWWGQWLGPVAWGASGAVVALDLQGPAYRKTIPVMLYLGLVSMRKRKRQPP